MKKFILICSILITNLFSLSLEDNDKLIKENIVYLLAQVKEMKKKISGLEKKIKEINNTNIYKKKNIQQTYPKSLKNILEKIYRVTYDVAPAYKAKDLTGKPEKIYHYMDIVRVIKKDKKSYQLDNLLWIDKKYLEKMKLSKEKFNFKLKVSFYKIETYMANVRTSPNSSDKDTIVRVLRKNDIVKVIDFVKTKQGKTWAKLDDGNYINFKLLKPIIW